MDLQDCEPVNLDDVVGLTGFKKIAFGNQEIFATPLIPFFRSLGTAEIRRDKGPFSRDYIELITEKSAASYSNSILSLPVSSIKSVYSYDNRVAFYLNDDTQILIAR